MRSNRVVLVEREIISGRFDGLDCGPELWCVARAPDRILAWSKGHKYQSGRDWRYGESHLTIYPRPNPRMRWFTLVEGGRISPARLLNISFGKRFDAEEIEAIIEAVRRRKTAIIEGGGPPLIPARRLGADVYRQYREALARHPLTPADK